MGWYVDFGKLTMLNAGTFPNLRVLLPKFADMFYLLVVEE